LEGVGVVIPLHQDGAGLQGPVALKFQRLLLDGLERPARNFERFAQYATSSRLGDLQDAERHKGVRDSTTYGGAHLRLVRGLFTDVGGHVQEGGLTVDNDAHEQGLLRDPRSSGTCHGCEALSSTGTVTTPVSEPCTPSQ